MSFVAGEVTNRNAIFQKIAGLEWVSVMVLYVSANIAYMNVMTVPEIAATERVGQR